VLGHIIRQNDFEYLQKVFSEHFFVNFLWPLLQQPIIALKYFFELFQAGAEKKVSDLAF
jgi:hypothetical protein